MLTEYTDLATSSSVKADHEVTAELVFDTERDHYQVVDVGWQNGRRVYGTVLHIDIKDGRLWIQHNGTEMNVDKEHRMSTLTISMKVGQLPEELQREVGDYIEFLLYKYHRKEKGFRRESVQRIDALWERLFAKYGEMADSVDLIREDRAR